MNTAESNTTTDMPREMRNAQDAAYTINHAIACTVTDVATPYISHTFAKKFGHKHDSLLSQFVGEWSGDLVAVPVTIALERMAPGATQGLRKVMEKTLGWAFRSSAKREGNAWARQNALAADSPEAKAKTQQIYDYEIEHLPQAAIWTATSMVFNVVTQKLFHKQLHKGHDHGHDHGPTSLMGIASSIVAGKVASTAVVVGARAIFPDKARQWDSFAARHVFEPLESITAKLTGGKKEAGWEKRMDDRGGISAANER